MEELKTNYLKLLDCEYSNYDDIDNYKLGIKNISDSIYEIILVINIDIYLIKIDNDNKDVFNGILQEYPFILKKYFEENIKSKNKLSSFITHKFNFDHIIIKFNIDYKCFNEKVELKLNKLCEKNFEENIISMCDKLKPKTYILHKYEEIENLEEILEKYDYFKSCHSSFDEEKKNMYSKLSKKYIGGETNNFTMKKRDLILEINGNWLNLYGNVQNDEKFNFFEEIGIQNGSNTPITFTLNTLKIYCKGDILKEMFQGENKIKLNYLFKKGSVYRFDFIIYEVDFDISNKMIIYDKTITYSYFQTGHKRKEYHYIQTIIIYKNYICITTTPNDELINERIYIG